MGMLLSQYNSGASGRLLFGSQSGNLVVRINGSTIYLTTSVSTGVWYHIAWTFDGTTHRLFKDGVLVDTSTMPSLYTGVNTSFGGQPSSLLSNYNLNGYMSNIRVVSGTALYTATFTPPTSALTAVSGTIFLAAQGETPFVDNSTNAYTITQSGGISADGYSPFDDPNAGEGGLVWIKSRSAATNHFLFDTERGALNELNSNTTDAEASLANSLTAFNSDGFSISSATGIGVSAATYASWTFRKAEKFFDVVTYTGDGNSGRTVDHSLGSTPGMIICKRTDGTSNWFVWHRSLASNDNYLLLNATQAETTNSSFFGGAPTDTTFTVGSNVNINGSGSTYVAYLFAHDAGGFGDDGLQNVISCGGYTGNGSATGPVINLGWEPQWLLIKASAGTTEGWFLFDSLRGIPVGSNASWLRANESLAETTSSIAAIDLNATGFQLKAADTAINGALDTYIYIAIRRGPMKTPTAGTEVYNAIARTGTGATATVTGVGFPTDLVLTRGRSNGYATAFHDRLRGVGNYILSSSAGSESSLANGLTKFDLMDGIGIGADTIGYLNESGTNYIYNFFKRAPGFFDVVCYGGTGSARTVNHNLGVVPELIIVKSRSSTDNWAVYYGDNTDYLVLNSIAATADNNGYWNDTSPTSTVFTVGTVGATNELTRNYVAYLFASLAGMSKVGTYTGNGSSVTVTTGFQPRFILVKRTNSTGNWIVGDSARGLVAGDDPFLLLNSTAAETTNQDWVDISATGFTVNQTVANANVNTGTYIYLCIA
jgi:hypothetical protein